MSKKSYKFEKLKDPDSISTTTYPHKHCPVCNRMVDPEEEYCSEECQEAVKKKDRKGKIRMYVMIGVAVIAMVAVVVLSLVL
jgi:predicted nucleic acid-binding Zn ribbon protein